MKMQANFSPSGNSIAERFVNLPSTPATVTREALGRREDKVRPRGDILAHLAVRGRGKAGKERSPDHVANGAQGGTAGRENHSQERAGRREL